MKTLSLRIRGAKADLEDLGESTDDMCDSTSTLQKKLLALSGGKVDIMEDPETFKSTTQILREFAAIWDDLTDINSAAILELLGGKRQANILSAIIENFDIVEDVIQQSADSAGSALKENEKYLDSIEGKTERFTNATQNMWVNMINSDLIKNVVDLGTGLVNLIDKLGALKTLAAGFAIYATFSKKIPNLIATANGELTIFGQTLQQIKNNYATLKTSGSSSFGAGIKSVFGTSGTVNLSNIMTEDTFNAEANKIIAGFNGQDASVRNATDAWANYTRQLTNATPAMQAALQNVTTTNGQVTLGAGAYQTYATSAVQAAQSTQKIGIAAKAAALGAGILNAALNMGIGLLVSAAFSGIYKLIDKAVHKTENLQEAFQDATITVSEINDELKTTKERIEELEAQGVLSIVDQKELETLRQTNDELERRLRLAEKDANSAGNKARQSVARDFEREFIKSNSYEAQITDKDANRYNELNNVKNALDIIMQDSTWSSLPDYQQKILSQILPDVYQQLQTTTWTALDSSTQQVIVDIYNQYLQELQNLDFVTDTPMVNGSEYIDQTIQKIQELKKELEQEGLTDEYVVEITTEIDTLESDLASVSTTLYDYLDQYGADIDDEFTQRINGLLELIDKQLYPGEYVTEQFDAIMEKYPELQKELYNLALQGELTEEVLEGQKYTTLMNELDTLGLKAKNVADHINSLNTTELSEVFLVDAVNKSFSSFSDTLSTYQEAQSVANEVTNDYMELSEEQGEQIDNLIEGMEGYSDAIDKSNGYIVKDAALLKKLIAQKKVENAQNVRLSKSQARLQYYNLVKQYQQLVSVGKTVDSSLLDQIDTVELMIGRYELLEQQLLGTTNAFKDFEDAQTLDAEVDYADQYSEMLSAINEGLQSGKVGTQTFQVAMDYLVPEDVYSKLSDPIDQMDAKVKYLTETLKDFYTFNDDEIEVTEDNLKNFVAALQSGKDALMTGDSWDEWAFVEDATLDAIAEKLNITETAAYALVSELGKYTVEGSNLIAQLDGSLEGQIYDETKRLKEATDEYYAYLKSGGKAISEQGKALREEMDASTKKMEELSKTAADNASQYLQYQMQLAVLEETRKNTSEQNTAQIEALDEQIADTQAKMEALGEPTQVTLQLAVDYLDQQIAETEIKLRRLSVTVGIDDLSYQETKQTLDTLVEQRAQITTNFDMDGNNDVQDELEGINEYKIGNKSFTVSISNYSIVYNQIKDLVTQMNKINGVNIPFTLKSPSTYSARNTTSYAGLGLYHTAYADGSDGLSKNEHNALVGELGPELVCSNGHYYTVGDNGAEFVDLPKGSIIFNHDQTEQLLKHGYTNTRGRTLATGNAFERTYKYSSGLGVSVSDSSDSSDDSDDTDDTEEVIDFIEYKLEEIDNQISKTTAKIENFLDDTSQTLKKNNQYDALISAEKSRAQTYLDAATVYNKKATALLKEVPSQYREMAKNGAIQISDFIGEDEAKVAEAIQKYREWAQKADDAETGYLESIAQISAYRVEQLQDIADDFENIVGVIESQSDLLQAEMDYLQESGERLSEKYYKELIKSSKSKLKDLEKEKKELQSILDNAVKSGEVEVGSDAWYEMVDQINKVDLSIVECRTDIEGFQNDINDLHWDNLDKFIDSLDNINSEISHLYDLLSEDEKVVDEAGNWTDEGVTSLGLLAQQMELAQYKADEYGKAIEQLKKGYKAGVYSEDEYNEKLQELQENQWDSIEAYESAKDAIVSLNKVRVDAAKNAMQKEIDAYQKLIEAKKKSLQQDQDAHDFEKDVAEKNKEIAKIQKQIAALSGNSSAEANARRKQLQADLTAAQEELDELYYDNSIETQQDALDKELENYEQNKQDEMDALDEWLKNEETVISESMETVRLNTETVLSTINETAKTYGIKISDSIVSPWENGANAISGYKTTFDTLKDGFTDGLDEIKTAQDKIIENADNIASNTISTVKNNQSNITAAKKEETNNSTNANNGDKTSNAPELAVGSTVDVKNGTIWYADSYGGGSSGTAHGGKIKYINLSGTYPYNIEGLGWVRKKDIVGYAKGTTGVKKDQLAMLDELGDELVLRAGPDGKLQYLTKGTGVVPADLTQKLMDIALDPTKVLDDSRPKLGAPHITTNNFEVNLEFGSLVHVDTCDKDTLPELQKMVKKEFDGMMNKLNNALYSKVR